MTDNWVHKLKARGWGAALSVALDALEPLGPLGAQALWVFQPLSGLFGAREIVRDIALALEEPGGIEHLRQELEK